MKRFSYILILAIFLTGTAWGQQVKFIDTRLLLLAHPLYRQFSADTARFSNTPSEPVPDGEDGIRRVESELSSVQLEYAGLPGKWAQRLSAKMGKSERKSTEEAFIAEQKRLQEKSRMLEDRLRQLRGVPGRPGLTNNMSMAGQVITIARDIRATIARLKTGFNGVVMDISPLMPDRAPDVDTKIVYSNMNFQLWRASSTPDGNAVAWLDNAKRFLYARHQPLLPVVYGGIDARVEAVKILEQVTGGR